MVETVKHHDFVEVEYTGKLIDGMVFDTTNESVSKINNFHNPQMPYKPAVVCVGENQILRGLDEALEGKEIGKEYTVTISAEKAFGKSDIQKLRIVPMSNFKEHKVQPKLGLQIDVDGEIGAISRVSGGRVIVNFNHPLAGKKVVYTFKINKKVTDAKEQVVSFLNMVLKIKEEAIKIEVKNERAVVGLPGNFPPPFTEMLSKKLLEITSLKELEFETPSQSQ